MAKYSIILVITALILPYIQALEFERQPEDEMLDKWLQEQIAETQSSQGIATGFANFGTDDLGYATPGHVEEHEYMTAFFDNQDHDAFTGTATNEGYDNANADIDEYLADFFGYTETQDVEEVPQESPSPVPPLETGPSPTPLESLVGQDKENDSDLESLIADYFKNEKSDKKPAESYTIFAKIEEEVEDEVINDVHSESENNIFDNFFEMPSSESHAQTNNPENDLDLWFKAMTESEDEAEEEEKETSLVNSDFADNFPDDDMFWHVSIQDLEAMDKECVQWKNDAVSAQQKVKDFGLILQKKIEELELAMNEYNQKQKISCERHCDMVCIPVRVGEECLQEVNGTCSMYGPIIDECKEKQKDPDCEVEESDCRVQMEPYALKVEKLEAEKMKCKEDLDAVTLILGKVMEEFPPQCENSTLQ